MPASIVSCRNLQGGEVKRHYTSGMRGVVMSSDRSGLAVLGDAIDMLGTAGREGNRRQVNRMFGKHRVAPTSGHCAMPHVAGCQRYCESELGKFGRYLGQST